MAVYAYKHRETGTIREIVRPMTDAPPIAFTDELGEWIRDFSTMGAVTKCDGGVRHSGQVLPVSKSMPLDFRGGKPATLGGHNVVELADGSYRTLDRRRIIRNKSDREKHVRDSGVIED